MSLVLQNISLLVKVDCVDSQCWQNGGGVGEGPRKVQAQCQGQGLRETALKKGADVIWLDVGHIHEGECCGFHPP